MTINASEFNAALEEIEASKGIDKQTVLSALEEALIRGYRKQLGGDDADVRVNIDAENGLLEMWQVKVVKDEVEDDFLEISTEDANAADKKKKYKDGDEFFISASIDDLKKATAMSIKSIMRQKFAEAEKSVLYEAFKDKIGTTITGTVEKVEERGVSVNIVRTSVYLPRNQLIGEERFQVGDPIKLYINDVSNEKAGRIVVTRSSEGFLRCVLMEEIPDLYNGSVLIKNIAREAGERSKVAVYSPDPNIDPAGACIGPNGSKIQKVVGQLGNGSTKEKIDVISYSENPGLFIIEALKPARVAGINVDLETKSAVAIVKDDSFSLAIGRKGTNVRLAVKLTGYNIDIKTESEAVEQALEYQTIEELQAQELELKNKLQMEAAAAKVAQMAAAKASSEPKNDVLPGLPEGYVAPFERKYDDENTDLVEALEAEVENNDEAYEAPKVEEVKVVSKPVEEKKAEEPVKTESKGTTKVKTTTSIADLEASLDDEKDSKKQTNKKKSSSKKKDETAEETKGNEKITDTSNGERMSIYTDEELRAIEAEEENDEDSYDDDEDVDYDEYDDYYDDDDR